MKTKYFVPEIKDITIGYECEIKYIFKSLSYADSETQKMKLSSVGFWRKSTVDKDNFMEHLDLLNSGLLRVQYLNNSQIEEERVWGLNLFEPQKYNNLCFYRKDNIKLQLFKENTKYVKIVIGECIHEPDFEGYCTDINTFRFIVRKLKY